MVTNERRLIAVSLLLVASVLVFGAYHFSKFNDIYFNLLTGYEDYEYGSFKEVYLLDYDEVVGANSTFIVFASEGMNCSLCEKSTRLDAGENELSYEYCENKVALNCGGRVISFGFIRGNAGEEVVEAGLNARVENRTVFVELDGNGSTNGRKRVAFEVDGKTVFEPLVELNGSFELNERMKTTPGRHVLSAWFAGEKIAEQEFEAPYSFDFSLLIVVGACLLLAGALSKNRLTLLLLFVVLLAVSFVIHFRLEYCGFWWLAPLVLFAALFVARKQKKYGLKVGGRVCFEGVLFALFIALFVLVQTILVGNTDVWGAYYFRHVQEAFDRGTTGYADELSYLGRNFTYPPIFFEFSAQAMKLFNLNGVGELQTPWALVVCFAYAFTLSLLFAKFDGRKRLLAALIFFAEWAMLYMAAGITIQIFSYTLLNIAVLLTPTATLFALASLGLSIASHPTSVILYPFYLLIVEGGSVDWRRAGVIFVGGCVFALLFFAPVFAENGLPSEIVPAKWGYLLAYGLEGMQYDFQFLVPIIFVSIIYGIYSRKTIQSLALLALFAANAFVSSRINLLLSIASAAFIPVIFERELKEKWFWLLLAGVVLVNYAASPVIASGTKWWCSWGMANEWCVSPMDYIARYASADEIVAINPYFGHLETRYGGKRVVADLYVEWADYEKWKAENDFYEKSNASLVEGYNATLFVLDDLHEKRGLEKSRVYDNGFTHIFR